MSYLALARKWRPRTFSQLVGQEHINKALINSLNQQRLHHAYLFTGTHGVGKTSVARLLAKALNCETGVSSEPCLQCDACMAIEQGRFIDLIEIDGASRTRVEDTRELLDNVQYAPASGRFKIYLIDEVHMLSQHSFNALLKTLEEPPAHVKFLLATTDPQKLPVTVLSRCLQFTLKNLPQDLIVNHLNHILTSEMIRFDPEALQVLAKAAKGSMRDALSLLDQSIASSNGHLAAAEVKSILGYTQQDYAIQLLHALASTDASKLMLICRQIAVEGGHFQYVLDELINHLHQIAISQTIGLNNPLIAVSADLLTLSQDFNPEDIQLFYQIAIKGSGELGLAPTLAIGFEMLLLRMLTFRPAAAAPRPVLAIEQKTIASVSKTGTSVHETPKPAPSQITDETVPWDEINDLVEDSNPIPDDSVVEENFHTDDVDSFNELEKSATFTPPPVNEDTINWINLIAKLKLSGLTQNAAENAEFISKSGKEITLRVSRGHQSLFTPSVTARLEQALETFFGSAIKIVLNSDESVQSTPAQVKQIAQTQRQQNAEATLQNDPFFQQLRQEFSAELVKNSIEPVKNEL